MNFKERLTALELEMVHARSSGNTEKLKQLERTHDDVCAQADEYAYVRACELDSPNSPDFEHLCKSIYEELVS